jgi:hypothetical protein
MKRTDGADDLARIVFRYAPLCIILAVAAAVISCVIWLASIV